MGVRFVQKSNTTDPANQYYPAISGNIIVWTDTRNGNDDIYAMILGQRDRDLDSIGDLCGNCPTVSNSDQLDSNMNNIGDLCDLPDFDNDGIYDHIDNCPNTKNPNQEDTDGDRIGNACDLS